MRLASCLRRPRHRERVLLGLACANQENNIHRLAAVQATYDRHDDNLLPPTRNLIESAHPHFGMAVGQGVKMSSPRRSSNPREPAGRGRGRESKTVWLRGLQRDPENERANEAGTWRAPSARGTAK